MGSTMSIDFYLYIATVFRFYGQLWRSVNQMFFCIWWEFIVICHKQCVKWTSIYTQPTKYTFTKVYLWHDGFLVVLPLFVHLYHTNCFSDPFTSNSTELTACTLIMKQNVSTPQTRDPNCSLRIELITITNKFEFLLGIPKCEPFDKEMFGTWLNGSYEASCCRGWSRAWS